MYSLVLFTGNYNSTKVILNDNRLTRFEEGVFKSMLQDMPGIIDGFSGGTLDINPSMNSKNNVLEIKSVMIIDFHNRSF